MDDDEFLVYYIIIFRLLEYIEFLKRMSDAPRGGVVKNVVANPRQYHTVSVKQPRNTRNYETVSVKQSRTAPQG